MQAYLDVTSNDDSVLQNTRITADKQFFEKDDI